MSSKMTTFEQTKQAMEEKRDQSKTSIHMRYTILQEWLSWVSYYSSMLCASYQVICEDCGSKEHLTYQCEYNFDPVLATYNSSDNCNASMEVIEMVLYRGAHELHPIYELKNKKFEMIYREVHHIYDFCYYNFRENALLINYSKRISTALEETELYRKHGKMMYTARNSLLPVI